MSDLGIYQIDIPGGFLPRCVVVPLLPTVHAGTEIMATLAPYFEDQNPATEEGAAVGAISLDISPNPAGGAATVTIRLLRAGTLRVEVFDAAGRRVAIVHRGLLAAGEHRLSVATAGLRPGVYVARAEGELGGQTLRFTVR